MNSSNFPALTTFAKNYNYRAAWVAQGFSAAFGPGPDPGGLGLSPTPGSLRHEKMFNSQVFKDELVKINIEIFIKLAKKKMSLKFQCSNLEC